MKGKTHSFHVPHSCIIALLFSCAFVSESHADDVRVNIVGTLSIKTTQNDDTVGNTAGNTVGNTVGNTAGNTAGNTVGNTASPASLSLRFTDSCFVTLEGDTRYVRGIEITVDAPREWLANQGSLGIGLYNEPRDTSTLAPPPLINGIYANGIYDLTAQRIYFSALPGKLQAVYQIPFRERHVLRATPYAQIVSTVTDLSLYPLIVRLTPVIKGISSAVENMKFTVTAKPILSDEGTVRLSVSYPENEAQHAPFSVLIDDAVISDISAPQLLREGDHKLTIVSEAYRTENRQFRVNRGATLDIALTLSDLVPLLLIEAPENASVFLDNRAIDTSAGPIPTTPGNHAIRITVSGYTLQKNIDVERGKTYTVTFSADLKVTEE